jgi:hypothetical protein
MQETDGCSPAPANSAWHSLLRKLRDPFVYNKITQAAAIATVKSARRGGWQPAIGLKGGAPVELREMEESKCAFFGRYVESELELLISYYAEELTIVRRSEVDSDIKVNRTKIVQDTRFISSGEAVEKGEFTEEQVFKKYFLRGGPGENEIEIADYRIEKPELTPTHSSKLISITLFKFLNDNGIEKVKVLIIKIV